jgi:4-carboxymuconolactone decarboxylase
MTTPSPRIASADLPLSSEQAQLMAKLIPPGMPAPNLFLILARNAGLFKFMVDSRMLGPTGLMDLRNLSASLREAIILRTCVANGCDYEFNLHVQTISARMGLSPEQIDDIRQVECSAALWGPDLLAVFKMVDELVAHRQVSAAAFARVKQHFGDPDLLEITNLVGVYTGVAMMAAVAQPRFDTYQWAKPILTTPSTDDRP